VTLPLKGTAPVTLLPWYPSLQTPVTDSGLTPDGQQRPERKEVLLQCLKTILDKVQWFVLGCALVFASEAKIEIEAKISFRLEAKKRHDFACFT
jgi:hypothetical protein